MKFLHCVLFLAFCLGGRCSSSKRHKPPHPLRLSLSSPTEAQLKFYHDNVGAIIHFNMQTFVPQNQRKCCNTWDPSTFDPYLLDTDLWLSAAHSFHAKYVVMVVDHFSGFSLYNTSVHNYSVAYSKWMNGTGNVVKSFIASALKYDIRPAMYYSTHENWFYNVSNFNLSNETLQTQFETAALTQLYEIAHIFHSYSESATNTNAANVPIAEVWFDAGVKQGLEFVNKVQTFVSTEIGMDGTCHSCENMPETNRVHWMGNEEAVMPYPNWGANSDSCANVSGDPYGVSWCPPHCDAVLREHIWFWHQNPPPVSSVSNLIGKYLTSVGRACNLILDIAPDNTGTLLTADVKQYGLFGNAIDLLFYNSDQNVTVLNNTDHMVMYYNASANNTNNPVFYELYFDGNLSYSIGFGCVQLMENITTAQRIAKHSIDIFNMNDDTWYALTNQTRSLTVGHRRLQTYNISYLNTSIVSNRIRITIDDYVGEQNPELLQLQSVQLFEWTSLQNNNTLGLHWQSIIIAGQ